MATPSWTIVPIPLWYFADNVGRPAGGGKLYTGYAINPTLPRAVASNPAGTTFYTNPILFDENGESPGPLFWEDDGTGNDQGYFLRMLDADDNLLWTMNNYGPGIAGGGGGSIITAGLSLDNQLVNGVFINNTGTITGAPTVASGVTLAPGAHSAFGGGTVQTDIFYKRATSTCSDIFSFPQFFPSQPFQAFGDVTPVYALNYKCTSNPGGESYKYVYFPITANVQNLSNTDVTITLWGTCISNANQIELLWAQNYGDGPSSSGEILTGISTLNLPASPTWEKFSINDTVPDTSANSMGECGNGALYLVVGLPINALTEIQFTKLCVYLGNNAPDAEFESFDHIGGITNSPRTGDYRITFNSFSPGWVIANDGSIGSAGSVATTRANIDTFPLYSLIWNSVSDTYAPVSGGRGGSAVDDFVANKTLTLTKMLGRMLISQNGGTIPMGSYGGSDTATLTNANQLPAHTHGVPAPNVAYLVTNPGGAVTIGASGAAFQANVIGATASTGTSQPFAVMSPYGSAGNVFFKL